jgi:hypothetical protein
MLLKILHFAQALCRSRLWKAYLTYVMLQRQFNHLNGRKITSRHGPRRKHRFPLLYPNVAMETYLFAEPLRNNGFFIVASIAVVA